MAERWGEEFEADCRRRVRRLIPQTRQTIEAEDTAGTVYRFTGEAVALSPVPSWPNAFTWDSVVRWTDDQGRVGHGPCQGIWYDAFARLLKERRRG